MFSNYMKYLITFSMYIISFIAFGQGVKHPDDMSAMILTSYYRHLLGKEIDFEGQLTAYKKQAEQ
jgi:hypothetical protein